MAIDMIGVFVKPPSYLEAVRSSGTPSARATARAIGSRLERRAFTFDEYRNAQPLAQVWTEQELADEYVAYLSIYREMARATAEAEARWPNQILKLEHECEIAGHEIDCPVCSRLG